ncbi:transposase [Bathymodiolus japonicus methanotrophic gill symbiont]
MPKTSFRKNSDSPTAQATIDGIETAHMIRKGQLSEENIPAYKQFMALAG